MQTSKNHDTQLEMRVIGCCLQFPAAYPITYKFLTPEVFHDLSCREVYRVMEDMYSNHVGIDVVTLPYHAKRMGIDLQTIAAFAVRCNMLTGALDLVHLEIHCLNLKEMWIDREAYAITHSGTGEMDTFDKVVGIKEKLARLTEMKKVVAFTSFQDGIFEVINEWGRKEGEPLTVGYDCLDAHTGGLLRDTLTVIAARPGVGKTAFMAGMVIGQAKQGKRVGIITLEMSNRQIVARLSSIITEIECKKIERGIISDEQDRERMIERIVKNSDYPIYLSDETKVDPVAIQAAANDLKFKHGLDVLFIDYLQLVEPPVTNRNYNREQEVAKMSRHFKLMAKELEIPVVLLCQLNRASENRADRRPRLSDLRESGAIEQDADNVWLLYRNLEPDSSDIYADKRGEVIIAKSRGGALGIFEFVFDGAHMLWHSGATVPYRMKAEEKKGSPEWGT